MDTTAGYMCCHDLLQMIVQEKLPDLLEPWVCVKYLLQCGVYETQWVCVP